MNQYPKELLITKYKINKRQFGRFGLPLLTELECVRKLNDHIKNELQTKHNMNINKLRKYIFKFGNEFMNTNSQLIPSEINLAQIDTRELYTQFVGDYFEAFAEFFLKTFDNDSRFGVKKYIPNIDKDDMGVDGSGFCYDDTKSLNPCVVQVKYRINELNEIDYSALARTCAQGVMQYDLNVKVDNCIILFSSCKGSNYNAKKVFGNTLFEINDKVINQELNNVELWENFFKCFEKENNNGT